MFTSEFLQGRRRKTMQLHEVVEKYSAVAREFGEPVELARFGLSREETEKLFSGLDEDYHISRFFHFTNGAGQAYNINEFPYTHMAIDAAILEIL
jgi:hypothetical protein